MTTLALAGDPDPLVVARERDRTMRHIWVAVIERRAEIHEEERKDLANRIGHYLARAMG